MTDPTFIVCFQSVLHLYGYFSRLVQKLQCSSLDILQGYKMIELVKDTLSSARSNDAQYNKVFDKAESMAEIRNVVIALPRKGGRQTERSNVPRDTPKVYFKISIYLPFLDSLIQQYNMRFNSLSQKALNVMALISAHLHLANSEVVSDLFTFFKDDLPLPSTFDQELNLWRRQWYTQVEKPKDLSDNLTDSRVCTVMYPKITKILHLLLLTSVTSSTVE